MLITVFYLAILFVSYALPNLFFSDSQKFLIWSTALFSIMTGFCLSAILYGGLNLSLKKRLEHTALLLFMSVVTFLIIMMACTLTVLPIIAVSEMIRENLITEANFFAGNWLMLSIGICLGFIILLFVLLFTSEYYEENFQANSISQSQD